MGGNPPLSYEMARETLAALEQCGGNKVKAAELLGISDGYACRMGCMLVDAGVTNINSRPQPAGSGPNKES